MVQIIGRITPKQAPLKLIEKRLKSGRGHIGKTSGILDVFIGPN